MFRDLLSQAYEAMMYNRRRTLITMIGMAWGIATVVLLMAYGAGFGRAIEAIFSQFGTNIMGVFPGTTSQQAGGKKAGVQVRLQLADLDLLQENVPGLIHIAPEVSKDVSVQNDTHSYTWSVSGSYPVVADVHKLDLDYGRFYTNKDLEMCIRDRSVTACCGRDSNPAPGLPGRVTWRIARLRHCSSCSRRAGTKWRSSRPSNSPSTSSGKHCVPTARTAAYGL